MKHRGRLIVVSDPRDLPADVGRAVTADEFLSGTAAATRSAVTVVNLCRSWRYLSKGYYVSLLAEARGQIVLPTVDRVESLSSQRTLFRALQEADVETVDLPEMRDRRRLLPAAIIPVEENSNGSSSREHKAVPLVQHEERGTVTYRPASDAELAETAIFLGSCRDRRFQRIASVIYRIWGAPLLHVSFMREEDVWKVLQVRPLRIHRLTVDQKAELVAVLKRRSAAQLRPGPDRDSKHVALAVLYDPNDPFGASTPETLDRFERVASEMGVYVGRLLPTEISRLGDFDALFVRSLAGLETPAFRFALRAESLGMPVIDDTRSIIRCGNKVYLHELLARGGLPTPRTLIATRKTRYDDLVVELGHPFILKLPDGSFSGAVFKITTREDFRRRAEEMFRSSPLLIGQTFTPTDFDWRVTTIEGKVLFVCKYHMAPGHWQIRQVVGKRANYGKVEAVPRDLAPREVVRLASKAARLIGDGFYGIDLKETSEGPQVIEINDNPNLDIGYEDAADGDLIYQEIVAWFTRQVKDSLEPQEEETEPAPGAKGRAWPEILKPIGRVPARQEGVAFRAFEVCGIELEYPIVDRDLNVLSRVEPLIAFFAGHPASDVELGILGISNEIMDHVLEIKTSVPLRSLARTEEILVEGVRRISAVLAERFDARLLPTGMHPWFDPRKARMWTRSNRPIYETYDRLFDVRTHGWANVQASHVNLPLGREHEAVAMMNAAALLIPYLPALAASTPMYEGELRRAADNRLAYILEHQSRIPESCGAIVPEYIDSLSRYRRQVLAPMYRALKRFENARALKREFFNSRGAVFKFSRDSMEVRVLDVQECVRMDLAIAVFVRGALKALTEALVAGRIQLPDHAVLVADFHASIEDGTRALVRAPHIPTGGRRAGPEPRAVRDVLEELLEMASRKIRTDELDYLERVWDIIELGNLSERIRDALEPHAGDTRALTEAARGVYIELSDCLRENRPWRSRQAPEA